QTADPVRMVRGWISDFERKYADALDDDLNVANAVAALFELVTHFNRQKLSGAAAEAALDALDRADAVLGVLERESKAVTLSQDELEAGLENAASGDALQAILAQDYFTPDQARALALARHAARRRKEFAVADAIRDRLKDNGVVFEDTKTGVRIKLP